MLGRRSIRPVSGNAATLLLPRAIVAGRLAVALDLPPAMAMHPRLRDLALLAVVRRLDESDPILRPVFPWIDRAEARAGHRVVRAIVRAAGR